MTEQLAAQEVETAPQEELETETLEQANSEEETNEPEAQQVAPKPPEHSDNPDFIPETDMSERVKRRINKLTFEKHEVERQLNAEIADLQAEITKLRAQPAPGQGAAKTLADFDYDEDKYLAFKIEEGVKAAQPQSVAQPSQQNVAVQAAQAQWVQRQSNYAAGSAEYTSYVQSMPNAVQSKAVESFILNSEKGPEVHHALLSNYDDLARIQALPEWQQGAELGKIESTLTQTKAKAKQRSKAPEPVKPVETARAAAGGSNGSVFPTSW